MTRPEPALTIHRRPIAIIDQQVFEVTGYVRFRMLEPSEIKRGMAFPAEYVMLGNRREQVKMAGNAVVPPAARDLVGAVAESLGVVS